MNRKAYFAPIAAMAIMTAAMPAAALAKGQDGQPTNSSASNDKGERKICKTFASTESRMKSTRLCLTKAEWKKFDAAD
jgi:hypothetical protein